MATPTPEAMPQTEMGDDLPFINVTNANTDIIAMAGGLYHTCALLVTGQLKCFGENFDGRAGFELDTRLGDGPNEMRDNLPFVDVAGSSGLQVVNVSASSTSTAWSSTTAESSALEPVGFWV